jgi:hypothetical protein
LKKFGNDKNSTHNLKIACLDSYDAVVSWIKTKIFAQNCNSQTQVEFEHKPSFQLRFVFKIFNTGSVYKFQHGLESFFFECTVVSVHKNRPPPTDPIKHRNNVEPATTFVDNILDLIYTFQSLIIEVEILVTKTSSIKLQQV